jgi:predicted hydrocarbon binding protein
MSYHLPTFLSDLVAAGFRGRPILQSEPVWPWEAAGRVFEAFWQWLTGGDVGALLEQSAMFLIVGGLAMLTLIVTLVLLTTIFPQRPFGPEGDPSRLVERQLRPTPWPYRPKAVATGAADAFRPDPGAYENGRKAGKRTRATSLETALDHVVNRGLGEPRILAHGQQRTRLRMYECRGCSGQEPAVSGSGSHASGCSFERGFIAGVLERAWAAPVRIQETTCHRRGQDACEFEVIRG